MNSEASLIRGLSNLDLVDGIEQKQAQDGDIRNRSEKLFGMDGVLDSLREVRYLKAHLQSPDRSNILT